MQQIKLDLSGKQTCTSGSDGGLSAHSSPPQSALQKKGAASPPRGEARSSRWPPAARGLRRVAPRSTAAILWLPPKPKRPLMSFVLVVFPQVECGLCVIVTRKLPFNITLRPSNIIIKRNISFSCSKLYCESVTGRSGINPQNSSAASCTFAPTPIFYRVGDLSTPLKTNHKDQYVIAWHLEELYNIMQN